MEAVVKGVTECIYPTELDFVESAQTNTVISGSATNALVPASFERRDVGSILVVIPDVAEDGSMINLSLTPELVLEPEWKKYEAKLSKAAGDEKVELEQPFFHAHSLQTTVSMYNGSTIILGGGAEGKDKDKLIYNFLTARLVDPSGEPIHEQDDFEEDEFIDEEQDEFIDDIDQLEEEESQEEVEEEEILEPEPEKEEVKEKEEDYNGPRFRAVGVNPFYAALDNPFSTFSIDVDTASYTMARNYMQRGYLPPAESVRTEEFVNFFDYAYKPPIGSTFKIYTECADSKFGRGLQMLKIGVKGRRIGREEQQGAILTFVVDTSGSMGTPNRLGLVKKSLRMLVENLSPSDMVAIIQFGADARIVMEHTPVSEKEQILGAIDKLQAEGFTNLENAMDLAFERAARVFKSGASNRILLCSDGAANMGADAAETILGRVEAYSKQGIYCSVFGFGIGSYNDEILEALADKGDGVYAFIDSEDEARRLFVDDMSATLNTIAKDVKIQVEFNPDAVAKYRQLGYENRQLTKEQFRDDTVDAGEVGSGQSVTALYELEMKPEAMGRKKMYGDYIAVVRVRYQRVDNGRIEEIEHTIWPRDIMGSFDDMDVRFRLAAAVAEFAEILRASPYAAGSGYQDVAEVLYGVSSELGLDKQIQELKRMVEGAGGMARGNF